jgi:hypothetical protein
MPGGGERQQRRQGGGPERHPDERGARPGPDVDGTGDDAWHHGQRQLDLPAVEDEETGSELEGRLQ